MNLSFYNIGGACCIIQVDNKVKIGCDPVLSPAGTHYKFKTFESTRLKGPIYDDSILDDVNIWLITHSHADHIDQLGIDEISQNAIIVTHKRALPLFNGMTFKHTISLVWKQVVEFQINGYEILIKAIPAFHANNAMVRFFTGSVNGYLLKVSHKGETKSIYITSDTVYHKKIIKALTNVLWY